jgi:hypothetical protein
LRFIGVGIFVCFLACDGFAEDFGGGIQDYDDSLDANEDIPPSWRAHDKTLYRDASPKKKSRTNSSWYIPRFAVGAGLNVPELIPFEAYMMFGKYFAIRSFYTPILPFNVRIEMPADVISTKKGIGVANPDFTIRMKAEYGAHYGAEAMIFPFGQSFFIAGGGSHRRMRLQGAAQSPILVCSLIEAAKDPPCADPNTRLQTQTELGIAADATTTAILGRAAIGGFWHIGRYGYFMMNMGYSKPLRIRRDVDIETTVDGPSSSDQDISGAIAEVKNEREIELEKKAMQEMRPVEEKPLPIFGIAAGVRL